MTGGRRWVAADLHLHTPASGDYQEPGVSYLDILRTAVGRGLNIIALTDHNTVAGYRRIREELEQLELLEKLGRIRNDERERLAEFRRLFTELLVLPGFEFTATLGFHILGIFPPDKPLRELDHLLLSLNIDPAELDLGSATVGASSDVLAAYRRINEAGGLAIAAHANSTNGVAMRGFPIGGQTKIAYTQDPNLHALEVTDLEPRGRRSTADFFNGTKPEYPRRMHCIQGSDAHRLRTDPRNPKNLGVGDRATNMLLQDVNFESLRELFLSNDFARTRPYQERRVEEFDFIRQAREEGPTIVQAFHEGMTARGGALYSIISDVCAFANTNGGTLFVGIGADPTSKPQGVTNPAAAVKKLQQEISNRISPPLNCQVDTQESHGVTILRILVPRGGDPPYAVDDNKIYVREEADTGLAVRDEIVQLVRGGTRPPIEPELELEGKEVTKGGLSAPRTGVEIVAVEERDGVKYFTVRDLRNGNVVKNVTQTSARRLWHYAITQYLQLPSDLRKAASTWQGELGLLRRRGRGENGRYDLAQETNGTIRLYFGVTGDGIHGDWKRLVGGEVE
ncbi:MAG TPA: RNA-binding domain-containing protein [Anaerolineales bacterium]